MEQVITAAVHAAMDVLVPVLVTALVGLVGWGADQLRKWHINATVARALARAAGAAIFAWQEGGRPVDGLALNRMVQTGVDFVNAGPSVAPLLPKAGIDQTRLEELIRAELGNRLPDLLGKAKA